MGGGIVVETRIRKLERTVEQQGYFIFVMITLFPFLAAAILVMWGDQARPDFDHIAVSLTVFQTLFGIAAMYGFWALRGLTREKAEEVAEAEVKKITPPLVRREVLEHLQSVQFDPISDEDLGDIVRATGNAGKEGDNGK